MDKRGKIWVCVGNYGQVWENIGLRGKFCNLKTTQDGSEEYDPQHEDKKNFNDNRKKDNFKSAL